MDHNSEQQTNSAIVASANETSVAAVTAAAKAEIEAKFIVARKFPRDLDDVRQKLLKDCKRFLFADGAEYKRPIGGKEKRGPSIRFMESAAMAYGNVDVRTLVLYDDDKKRQVRISVTDLESNIGHSQDFTFNKTVERSYLKKDQKALKTRRNSEGRMVYIVEATDDEVFIEQNRLSSKIVRNLLRRLVPSDLIDEGIALARKTVRDQDKADPDASRKRIADAFDSIGVPIKELKELLGHDLLSASPAEMENLRSVYTEIKDGEMTWDEVITKVREKRARKGKEKQQEKQQQPIEPNSDEAVKAEVVDDKTGEVFDEPELIELDFGDFKNKMLGELDDGTLRVLAKTAPHEHVRKGAEILLEKLSKSEAK